MQGRKDRVEPAPPAGSASLIEARLAPILPTPQRTAADRDRQQ